VLTADDVVASIERLHRHPHMEMAGYALYIKDVTALDPLTVRVRTTRPLAVLLNKLRFVAVVPRGAPDAPLTERPDGTGPFRLAEWRRGRSLRLLRNEEYWGARPALAEVELLLERDPGQAADDLLGGRVQLALCNSKRARARISATGRFEVLTQANLFLKYLGYDLRPATADGRANPFADRRVREALNLAVDRQRLVDGLIVDAVPARQLVTPAVFGYNARLPLVGFDAQRARRLLQEAGFGAGLKTAIHVRRILAEAADLLREQLRPAGFELDVKSVADEELFGMLARREANLHLSRFGCPTGDASDMLENALHSADPRRHMGVSNHSGYADAEMDRMIEESSANDSVARRRDALERIMARAMEALVWVPLYEDQDVYALDRRFAWRPRLDSVILAAKIAPRARSAR
jgi:peptide/nickel transport system substrate-binding protein